ncbi:MAG: GNAT family N-acetyltransferase, partial [Planctomycetota bacterium]
LRRKNRKLEKEFGDELKIVTYSGREDVPHAVSAAFRISQHTYQAGLGVGIVDDCKTRKILDALARHGWLRMSILFIKDEPCAFQFGLQYGHTYFLEQLGFCPKWTHWNVGTVLFNKILEDLCRDPSVERFNFGFGDAQYKRSYGSDCWLEASVCIFASRAYPLLVNVLESSTAGLSLGIQYIVYRTSLAGWIKRKWRRLLRPKSSAGSV